MSKRMTGLSLAFAAAVAGVGIAHAASEVQLPDTVSWSVYDVSSGTYQEAVAQASAIKKRYGVNVRLLPARNDVSRMAPLREGTVQFSAMGSGTLFIHEGVFDFGKKSWGPQQIQVVALNVFPAHIGFFASKSSDIKTVADLKGKRVPYVRGAPSLQELVRGYLAFGGLTLDDVTLVETPGFMAALQTFLQGQTDIGIATTLSVVPQRAQASPKGPIYWPPFPRENKAGWERLVKVLPFAQPITTAEGTAVPKSPPLEGITYALPIIITYASQDEELVYNMAKAIHESFPDYKDAVNSAKGFKLTDQSIEYPVSFHPGAIRYYKEIGLWKADDDARNAKLVERQRVLAQAWKVQQKKDLSGEAFEADWIKTRATALEKAGFDPIWK